MVHIFFTSVPPLSSKTSVSDNVRVESGVDSNNSRVDSLDSQVDSYDSRVDSYDSWVIGVVATAATVATLVSHFCEQWTKMTIFVKIRTKRSHFCENWDKNALCCAMRCSMRYTTSYALCNVLRNMSQNMK